MPGPGEAVDARVKQLIRRQDGRLVRFFKIGTGVAAGIFLALALFRSLPPVPEREEKPKETVLAAVMPPAAVGALSAFDPVTKRPVGEMSIAKLNVTVEVVDGVAQTTVEEIFFNETAQRLEGTFRFPLPPDASITRLAMEIDGKLMEGEVVERQKARQTYEGIVRRMKDPALLEWMPGGLFSCRIFPIEAKSPKRIIISYQQALAGFDGRFAYVYPLVGETTKGREIGAFSFTALVKGAKVSSPSHEMHVAAGSASMEANKFKATQDVVLELEMEPVEAVVRARKNGETGYFNLFLTPRADAVEQARVGAGTVFVVDCSASMTGPEMDVAKRAVERMIDALPGGTVFVIGHNVVLSSMVSPVDLKEKSKALEFLFALKSGGGLDFAMAVRAAMASCPDGGEIVFVGEGTPSLGESDAAKIVAGAREAVGSKKVTFRAVAVGSDADRVTLGAVASAFNGGVHAVSPSDDVNARLAQIARTVGRAAMTEVAVAFEGQVSDVAPASLGSVYFGERVMVAGKYTGGVLKAVLTGKVQGRVVRREWSFDLPAEEKGNLYVERLWAQRRVADLMAKGAGAQEEITKLGLAHRLMTPYTSLLVLESEKAYEEHAIERKKKEEEKLVVTGNTKTREEVTIPASEWRDVVEKVTSAKDAVVSQPPPPDTTVERFKVQVEQAQIEITNHIRSGERFYNIRQYDDALRELEAASFGLKRIPFEVAALKGLEAPVDALVRRTRDASMLESKRVSEMKRSEGEAEVRAHELARVRLMKERADLLDQLRGLPDRESTLYQERLAQYRRLQAQFEVRGIQSGELDFMGAEGKDAARQGLVPGFERFSQQGASRGGADATIDLPRIAAGGWRDANGYLGSPGSAGDDTAMEFRLALAGGSGGSGTLPVLADIPIVGGLFSRDAPMGKLTAMNNYFGTTSSAAIEFLDLGELGPGFVTNESARLQGYDLRAQTFHTLMDFDPVTGYRGPIETGKFFGGRPVGGQALDEARRSVDRYAFNLEERSTRGELERLEAAHLGLARGKKSLDEVLAMLQLRGVDTTNAPPLKSLEGRVTACDDSIGMVVISIGRDDGVLEGNEFTLYRAGLFVAKITINKVDRKWAAGRVTLKKDAPRVNDEACNSIFISAPLGERQPDVAPRKPSTAQAPALLFGHRQTLHRIYELSLVLTELEISSVAARQRLLTAQTVLEELERRGRSGASLAESVFAAR